MATRITKTIVKSLNPTSRASNAYLYVSLFSLFINTLTPLLVSYSYATNVDKVYAEELIEPTSTLEPTAEPVAEDVPASQSESSDQALAENTSSQESESVGEPTSTPSSIPDSESTPTPEPSSAPEFTPTPEPQPSSTPSPTEEPTATPTPEPESTPTPTPLVEPAPAPEPEPTLIPEPTPIIVEPTPTPTPTDPAQLPDILDTGASSEAVEAKDNDGKVCAEQLDNLTKSGDEDWLDVLNKDGQLVEGAKVTAGAVKLGVKYEFPLEKKVSVTFKCLPAGESLRKPLRIEQVKVADLNLPDGVKVDGEYAYDITVGDMKDGTFEYDVTLPKPEEATVQVSYIEKSVEEAKQEVKVEEVKVVEEKDNVKIVQETDGDGVKIVGLDHFTIFFTVGNPPTLTTAMVNGQSQVTVTPYASITVLVKVSTDSSSNWQSTGYRVGSNSWVCVDHTNHNGSGSYTEEFIIQAPSNTGTFNLTLRASTNNSCGGTVTDYPMSNAITVQPATVVANPTLPPTCGLDIVLVLDNSTSISSSEMTTMKNAMTSFTNALNGTPTQFSVVHFATTAIVDQAFTSNVATVNSKINAIPTGGGYTNWDDGLRKAQSTLFNRSNPNLVIFASDGNPNTVGNGPENNASSGTLAVDAARFVANAIKSSAETTRILALGIGTDLNQNNMKQISGPSVGTSLTDDVVVVTNFTDLANQLKAFATESCGGTITVNKYYDQVDEAHRGGAGWVFNVAGTSKITVENGQTAPVEVDAGTYSVTETSGLSGYTFNSASCYKSGTPPVEIGVDVTNGVGSIPVGNSDIVYCNFVNTTNKGSITIVKDAQPNDPQDFSFTTTGTGLSNFSLDDDSDSALLNTKTFTGLMPGTYSVTEDSIAGWDLESVTCDDGSPVSSISLQSDESVICTFVNVKQSPALSIDKTATPTTYSAVGATISYGYTIKNTGNITLSGPFSVSDDKATVTCTQPADGALSPNEEMTCTASYIITQADLDSGSVTNTASATNGTITSPTDSETVTSIAGKIVVEKQTLPDASLQAFEFFSSWGTTFTLTDGQTKDSGWLSPGSYSVVETNNNDWETTSINCTSSIEDNEEVSALELDPNEIITCIFTNSKIPTLTVTKYINPTTDDGLFNLLIDGNQLGTNVGNNFTTNPLKVDIGYNHQVTETAGTGADLANYTAVFGGDCDSTGHIALSAGEDKNCTITNTRKTLPLYVHKFEDDNMNEVQDTGEDSLDGWTMELYDNASCTDTPLATAVTETVGFAGTARFNDLYQGMTYWVKEVEQAGWKLTSENCKSITIHDDLHSNNQVDFGNRYIVPELTIAKWNDVVGNEEIGNEVLFTIRVTAHDNDVLDVIMTDLFSKGFKYVLGSWTAISDKRGDLKALGTTLEPAYASPGDWDLGDMEAGEVVTLSYLAEITDEIDPGTYKDLAWAQGSDLLENGVLATAEKTGYVDTNFVGTQVPVVVDEPAPEAKAKVKTTVEKEEVLGAATELPATGSNTLILLTIMTFMGIGLGLVLNGLGVSIKRKKVLSTILGVGTGMLLFGNIAGISNKAFAGVTPVMSVRLEKPESPVNNPFQLTFVAMEINNLDMTAKCLKKYSSDSDFSQFGSDIAVTAGGNTYNCDVNSSVLTGDGTYAFKVEVSTGGVTKMSNEESVVYNGGTPGKPKYIEKDKKGDCRYEVTFKTADDGGETAYVEIYRDNEKEYTVSDSKRIKTITIGSNQKESFDDELYGSECANKPYYSIRAFNSAGTPSSVRSEEVTKTEKVTVEGETTTTTGAIAVAGGGQVGGAGVAGGAEGAEVVLPGDKGTAGETGEETPEVLGEQEDGTDTVLPEEEKDNPTGFSALAKPALIGLGILGVILVAYASRKKKA